VAVAVAAVLASAAVPGQVAVPRLEPVRRLAVLALAQVLEAAAEAVVALVLPLPLVPVESNTV
jgi:hypothetical protein